MEIPKFWRSVRAAVQGVYRAGADTPNTPLLTREEVQTKLDQQPGLWLHLNAVAGYDESQLQFLGDGEREILWKSVQQFRGSVPPENSGNSNITTEQLQIARDALVEICTVLDFYRYRDWPGLLFGKQIERRMGTTHTGIVTSYRFFSKQFGETNYLTVYALISEAEVARAGGFLPYTRRLREQLYDAVESIAPGWIAQIRFRYDVFSEVASSLFVDSDSEDEPALTEEMKSEEPVT